MGADFVGADHYLVDENNKICAFALARNIPMPSSWLVRKEIMNAYPFDGSLSSVEDGDWWLRTERKVHKARCPRMLIRYRIRAGSLSSHTPSKRRKAKIVSFANNYFARKAVITLTFFMWFFSRQTKYLWNSTWDSKDIYLQ